MAVSTKPCPYCGTALPEGHTVCFTCGRAPASGQAATARFVMFLLDLGNEAQRIVEGNVVYDFAPLAPTNAFVWRVAHDTTGAVGVWGLRDQEVEVLATARFRGGIVVDLKQATMTVPTPYQWMLVEETIRNVLARAESRATPPPANGVLELPNLPIAVELTVADRANADPRVRAAGATYKRTGAKLSYRNTNKRVALWLGLGLVIGGIFIALGVAHNRRKRAAAMPPPAPVAKTPMVQPAPPPEPTKAVEPTPTPVPAEPTAAASFAEAIENARPKMREARDPLAAGGRELAGYAARKLVWSDVDVPSETTIPLALKDPTIVRGKRLCANGTLERIERRDLDARKIYVGRLATTDGDAVELVAVGSTGTLVKRSTAKFCGVVLGRSGDAVAMLGMFDLPENRKPIVEQ